jgi:hypothetical protein
MMNRIKWAEEYVGQKRDKEDTAELKTAQRNECILVSLIIIFNFIV